MLKIESNIHLSKYTTFQIGGLASHLAHVKNIDEICEAIKWAKENQKDYLVLGGGSNVLISDNGFNGLVIIYKGGNFNFLDNLLVSDGSVFTARLSFEARKRGLSGLDFAAGIPGTIGGAIAGNAGAYGKSMADIVESVEVYDGKKIKEYKNSGLKFGYRSSILKNQTEKIIVSVKIKLKKGNLAAQEDLERDKVKRVNDYGGANAGSYFKNIEVSKLSKQRRKLPSEYVIYQKVSVGKLIESVELKGKKIGGAMISKRHGNVILNVNKAKASDVLALEKLIKSKILQKYNIKLEPEIVKIGF